MSNTQNIEEDINFDDLNENTQNEIKSNKSKPTKPVKKKKGLMAVLVPSSGKEKTNDGQILPKTAQETVPYVNVYKNGVIESMPGYFTKSYKLTDINFRVASNEDQIKIFDKYKEFLASLGTDTSLQVVINNRNEDEDSIINDVMCKMEADAYNEYRVEMNNMIKDKMAEGRNNLVSEKYIVMDYFILDLVNKEINNYDIRIFDNFANSFSKIEKIEVTKHNDFKVINLLHENNNKTVMILNKLNNLIGLYSNDLIEIKDKFLEQNKYLKEVNLPNVSKIGDDFICKNRIIKQINLPIVEVIGNRFLNNNCSLESLSLPLLVKAGHVFMTWNEVLEEVNFLSLKVAGFDFLQNNKEIKVLNLPLLEKIGDASFLMNEKLEVFNAPCLQEVGDCLLRYDENLKHVIMPSLLGIGYDVNIKIKEELDKNIKVLKR